MGMWKGNETKMGNCEVVDTEACMKVNTMYGAGKAFGGVGNILVRNIAPSEGWDATSISREQVGIVTQTHKGVFSVDFLDDEHRTLLSLSKFKKGTTFMLYQKNVLSKSAYALQEADRKAEKKAQNSNSK